MERRGRGKKGREEGRDRKERKQEVREGFRHQEEKEKSAPMGHATTESD